MTEQKVPTQHLLSMLSAVLLCCALIAGCAATNTASTASAPTTEQTQRRSGPTAPSSMMLSAPTPSSGSSTAPSHAVTPRSTTAAPTTPRSTKPPARATRFKLFVHCGITYLTYKGKSYQAAHAQDAPARLPSPDGITRETGYLQGYLTITQGTAVFTVSDPTTSINGQVITFHLLPASADPVPLCA